LFFPARQFGFHLHARVPFQLTDQHSRVQSTTIIINGECLQYYSGKKK
jgi:hypothetical protein